MRSHSRSAFTLIEMLVVIGIMAILMGMVYVGQRQPSAAVVVDLAAKELQATLFKARSMAMRTGNTYGVTFHIENEGDGRVMWNKKVGSGNKPGHWYQIVGPQRDIADKFGAEPPNPRNYEGDPDTKRFRDAVRQALVGDRHYLPEGARILAIGDLDFGCLTNWQGYRRGNDWPDEYPRPWFGLLKPASACTPTPPAGGAWQLYPWGGYDLEYERNNPGRWAYYRDGDQRTKWPATGFNRRGSLDGGSAQPSTQATGPIVDGMMLDLVIMFYADGHAEMTYQFFGQQRAGGGAWADGKHYVGSSNSVIDKPVGMRYGAAGVQHDVRLTGGFNFTIARDVNPEEERFYPVEGRYDLFESEADALRTITPFVRVFVHQRTGEVDIRDEHHSLSRVRMNQRNLRLKDFGMNAWFTSSDDPCIYRPAHRHFGFTDAMPASIHKSDPAWNDSEEGWRGWHPPYEP